MRRLPSLAAEIDTAAADDTDTEKYQPQAYIASACALSTHNARMHFHIITLSRRRRSLFRARQQERHFELHAAAFD